jgi:hypothetical protein
MKLVLVLTTLALVSGCVSLNSVSLTSVPADRSQKVRADAERFIFMGFNFDNDFVNTLTSDLKAQCPQGIVSGVLTKSESVIYFPLFFWKNRVSTTGYCVPGKMAAGSTTKKRNPSDEESSSSENDAEPAVQ